VVNGVAIPIEETITGCAETPVWSQVRQYGHSLRAAIDSVNKWVESGEVAAPSVYFELNADGTLKRDAAGFALGGIRGPDVVAPIAANDTLNTGPAFCRLSGSHRYYTPTELKSMYGNHGTYVAKVSASIRTLEQAGYLLKADGWDLRRTAASSDVGK
jgi:hypothetical protein